MKRLPFKRCRISERCFTILPELNVNVQHEKFSLQLILGDAT